MAKILIVDDEPEIVRGLEDNLRFEGYQTASAANGEEALALALRGAPDLILLDVMMPKLSGFEVCRRLRADAATKGVSVLMVTALDQATDVETAVDAGTDDFITKPVRLEIVATVLARWVAASQAEGSDGQAISVSGPVGVAP